MYSNCPPFLNVPYPTEDSSDFLVIVPVLKVNPSIKWPDEFFICAGAIFPDSGGAKANISFCRNTLQLLPNPPV